MIKNGSKAIIYPTPILLVKLICTGEPVERSKRWFSKYQPLLCNKSYGDG
jgi:hypothetical protein